MKNAIKTVLKICITLTLLGYILIKNDLSLVFEYMQKISPYVWFFIFFLLFFQVVISAMRLSIFFTDQRFSRLLYIRLISIAYGFVLPGQLAAEGLKAYLLGKEDKNYTRAGAAVILEKLIGFIVITFIGLIGLLITRNLRSEIIIFYIVICIVLFLILIIINIQFFNKKISSLFLSLSEKSVKLKKVFVFLLNLIENWQTFLNNKQILIKSFIYCIMYQFVVIAIYSILSYGVGIGFIFFDWWWISALLTIAVMLPVSFGGMGIREAGIIGLLGIIGVDSEQSLAVSIGILIILFVQVIAGFGFGLFMPSHLIKTN